LSIFTDPKFYELIDLSAFDPYTLLEYILEMMINIPSWLYVVMLFASGFMILFSILYCRIFEKRKPYTLGFTAHGCVTEYLLGIVIGFLMICAPILACKITGCVTIGVSETINPIMILLFFVAFVFQGMGEEALFRGYLMTSLARRSSIWSAIIINSLMFSIFHMGNASFSFIAFINIFLFGIFASVFMLKRGSIWAVGAIHTVWNFVQGNVFGMNVSGIQKFDSIFETTQASHGAILHGGSFGPEGGLGATIVLLIMIAIALLLPTKACERVSVEEAQPSEPTASI
jgi:membrane protease YdiL (CAAX protease family)